MTAIGQKRKSENLSPSPIMEQPKEHRHRGPASEHDVLHAFGPIREPLAVSKPPHQLRAALSRSIWRMLPFVIAALWIYFAFLIVKLLWVVVF